MKIRIKILAVALMSVIAGVVCQAQTPKTTRDIATLSTEDVARIERALARNKNIWVDDSAMVVILLKQNNAPKTGVIHEAEEIISKSQVGDDWISYISYQSGSFWLTYVVERKGKYAGRLDVRLN